MAPISLVQSEITGGIIAFRLLAARLGFIKALKALFGVMIDQALGNPWRELGRPIDRKEALSRRQIGSAVLLERRLRGILPPEEARNMVAAIVHKASVDFLRRNVPALKQDEILGMDEKKRSEYLRNIQEKFFNADAEISIKGHEAMDLTISRCRFVELLDAIGERDMSPVFCEGDKIFFDEFQPQVALERPETLSGGGKICDFRFKWARKPEAGK